MKYCNNCGNQLNDAVKFCPVCGAKQPDTSSDSEGIEVIPTVGKPNNKKKIILISSIICATVIMILAGVIFLVLLFGNKKSNLETTTTEAATTDKETTEKITTEISSEKINTENIAAKEAYYRMISDIVSSAVEYTAHTISCQNENIVYQYSIYNDYSIEDFDSDGVVELMIYSKNYETPYNNSLWLGSIFDFYEYDVENDSVQHIHSVYYYLEKEYNLIFYDNAVIEIESGEYKTLDDGGIFLCVNTGMFNNVGCSVEYDDVLEHESEGEISTCLVEISKISDDTYYMYFENSYSYELSGIEGRELLDKLRDTDIIDAEINDFNLKDLSDVCGFDYDELVLEIDEKKM